MTPQRWQQIKELLNQALVYETSERESFLQQACAGDEQLYREVLAFLEHEDQAGKFLESALINDQLINPSDSIDATRKVDVPNHIPIKCNVSIGSLLQDRYLLQQLLGSGGFGQTFLAIDQHMHARQVVIKILITNSDEQWTQRKFDSEIKALLRLTHPNVVTIYDAGRTTENHSFIVMEYLDGVTLRSLMVDEGMSLTQTASIIQQLGRAISFAHEKGIYHRDLKPENIMIQLTPDGETVKIIDFGIATVKERLTEKTNVTGVTGTIAYMAPEQLKGRPSAGSDIYALGVIAYQMLTGQLPFDISKVSNDFAAIYLLSEWQQKGVQIRPSEIRPNLNQQAETEIMKALSYEAKDRHKRAKEFGDLLAEALRGNSVELSSKQIATQKSTTRSEPASLHLPQFEATKRFNHPIVTPIKSAEATQAVQPRTQVSATTAERQPAKKSAQTKITIANNINNRRRAVLAMTVSAAILLIILFTGYQYLAVNNRPAIINANRANRAVSHSLSYYGELRQYQGDHQIGSPIKLSGGITGETYFKQGDGLKFFITPSHSGYLYLINEEIVADNQRKLRILFPSPLANNGSAVVTAGREVSTAECLFDGRVGIERVWMIWSIGELSEINRAYQQWGNKEHDGEIKDAQQVAAIDRIIQIPSDRLAPEIDESQELIRVKTSGDLIVYALKLNHR